MGRRADRRDRRRQHRPDPARRLRPLAPRRRQAPLRVDPGQPVLGVRGRRDVALRARPLDDPPGRPADVGLRPAGRRRDLPRAVPVCLVRRRLGRAPGAGRPAPVQPGAAAQLPRVELPGRRSSRRRSRTARRAPLTRRADAELAERAGPGRGTGSRRRPAPRGRPPRRARGRRPGRAGGGRTAPRTTARSRFSPRRRPASSCRPRRCSSVDDAAGSGRTSPRTAGWTASTDAAVTAPAGERGRRGARGDGPARARRVADDPVRARLGHPARGVRRRDALAPPVHVVLRHVRPERVGDRGHRPPRARGVVRGDRRVAGARSSPTRRGRTGTRRRCSTSCTSWSTAERSGPTARRCPPTAGSPTPGADPAAGGPFGRFAQIECFDYPFYNTLDVDFYASFARLQLWPELERAVIREFVAAVDVHDPAIVEIQWSGKPATRKCPGALPHDVGGPDDDPFLRVNAYRYQDINVWKDLNCKFVLQLWRDAIVLGRRGAAARRLAGRRDGPRARGRGSIATATGCRSTTATRTRPTTRGR